MFLWSHHWSIRNPSQIQRTDHELKSHWNKVDCLEPGQAHTLSLTCWACEWELCCSWTHVGLLIDPAIGLPTVLPAKYFHSTNHHHWKQWCAVMKWCYPTPYLLQEPSLLLEHQDQWGVVVPASRMYAACIMDSHVYGLLIWGCSGSCALDVSDMTVAIWYGESARREF